MRDAVLRGAGEGKPATVMPQTRLVRASLPPPIPACCVWEQPGCRTGVLLLQAWLQALACSTLFPFINSEMTDTEWSLI